MKPATTPAFELGVHLACINAGLPRPALEFHKAAVATTENPDTPGYGSFERGVCKIAAQIFAEAGDFSFPHHLYTSLSKSARWYPEFERFTDPVLAVLGRAYNATLDAADEAVHTKRAAMGVLPAVAVAKGISWSPALLEYLLAAGVTAGAGAGSAYWALNRNAATDDAEVSALKAKVKHYTGLSRQIKEELGARRI